MKNQIFIIGKQNDRKRRDEAQDEEGKKKRYKIGEH